MEKTKNDNTFLKSALLLTFGGIIAKILGAVYRIPLTNLLGTFAMGLYQLVFPLYGLLITVSLGFSVAVSKAVARERQLNSCVSCKRILRCALWCLGGLGAILSLVLLIFAEKIAILQGNALVADAYKILSPAVFLVSLTGALKGYFQGQMKMRPTALSQIAEQLAKLILGLVFASNALPDELKAVNGAIFAITLSEGISLLVFIFYYFSEQKKTVYSCCQLTTNTDKQIYLQLFKTALPITLSGILAPLSQLIDSSLMLKLLSTDATRLYGIWSGPVHSLFAMPIMLSAGISSAILPDVSGNVAVGDKESVSKKVNLAFKLGNVIVMPCVVGFLFVSPQIIRLLYSALPVEDIYLSGRLLSLVAVASLLVCYAGTFGAVLQGAGKEYVSLGILAISIVVKTLINLILLPNQKVGVFAIAFSTILCYFVSVALNLLYLNKNLGIKIDLWGTFTKPLVACVFLAVPLFLANWLAHDFLNTKVGTVVVIAFAGIIYCIATVVLKVFDGLLPALKTKLKYRGKKYANSITSD